MVDVSNSDNYIGMRDVVERIEELEGEQAEWNADCLHCDGTGRVEVTTGYNGSPEEDDCKDCDGTGKQRYPDEWDGLDELKALKELQESVGDDDAQLIRETSFQDHAQELAEALHGEAIRNASWPFSCIDWEHAANELRHDYSSTEFDGVTYYYS